MNKLSHVIVKLRYVILIVAVALLIPSAIGYFNTRVNYDILTYLPEDIETMKGQDILLDQFGTGSFVLYVAEGMEEKDVANLKAQIEEVDHVADVIWYDTIMDLSVPMEMLPSEVYDAFNSDDATMMFIVFDEGTSSDGTMQAIEDIRKISNKQCFMSGMSAIVTDTKNMAMAETPIYVGIAVLLAVIVLSLTMDSYLIPIFFLLSIGMAIVYNMGTNIFKGEISFITQSLSAVLQLGVTLDYSIFLWHSYQEELEKNDDKKDAMANAITATFQSVIGSSITTVAGFIALCFMSFTLGIDLGIVMAKGVVFGVIGCVTILPSLILVLDKPLLKTRHKPILPKQDKLAGLIVKIFPVLIIAFLAIVGPAYYGYHSTQNEVYYDMGACLPEDIEVVKANKKLAETFNVASTHMLLTDSKLPEKETREMLKEIEKIDGIQKVIGMETVVGPLVPEAVIPDKVKSMLESENWKLVLINSEYAVASDKVNEQINEINSIVKKYDEKGMLIGEAPCMKDMIETTGHDFEVVNIVSIAAIFIIIMIVEKSALLPIILIAVIETAIFINLGLPHYLGQTLPFIAPICISTIQLGATVDYAILMTTRYKTERRNGLDKKEAVKVALRSSINSIIVSGMGLFCSTFGVALYSNIDIISSMCMLMARGAIISMICVIFILPPLLLLFDTAIIHTTIGMKQKGEVLS